MKRWSIILVTVLFLAWAAMAPLGCDDDDDDDDDDPTSYGQDIHGTYTLTMTIDEDTCEPSNVGKEENWIVEVEQTGDFGNATVWVTEAGTGAEEYELFTARVYGTVIVDAGIEEVPLGSSNCVKFTLRNYYLKVDIEEGTLEGHLTDDIFYQGQGCDSSSVDCRFERILTPQSHES